MQISNIHTNALETMNAKDVLKFLNVLLENPRFTKMKSVHTNSFIVVADKRFPLMEEVTLIVQTYGEDAENVKNYYKLSCSRSKDFGSSNGVNVQEMEYEDFIFELKFQKRFNEVM